MIITLIIDLIVVISRAHPYQAIVSLMAEPARPRLLQHHHGLRGAVRARRTLHKLVLTVWDHLVRLTVVVFHLIFGRQVHNVLVDQVVQWREVTKYGEKDLELHVPELTQHLQVDHVYDL